MGLIQAVKTKDTNQFWHLIKSSPKCGPSVPDYYIHPEIWEKHFYDRYNDVSDASNSNTVDVEDVPPWTPASISEIHALIAQLKHGKASGEDRIPPKANKNNLD